MLLTESNRQNLLLIVTVLSLVCFFSSFLLFVCAAYVKITIDSQMRLLETYNSDVLPAIFIAVGVINMGQNVVLVMVAFKLMTIDLRDSYVKSMKYILISGIVLVLFEVASAITSFVHISILDREFGEGISKAMNKYIEGGELKREIDSVQMEYACCGDKSYVDWFKYEWNFPTNLRTHGAHIKKYLHTDGKYYSDDTPFSCCDPRSPRPCIHHHIHDNSRHHSYNVNVETTLYVTGCRITLMAIYGKVLLTVGLVATLIACLKTTVLLLFRLLDTSLSKAQLLEDWEATTNAYIYKDDPNAESQSVKVKVEEGGDTTEAETTEADTTEADTTEADITEADTTDADITEAGEETATEASGDVNENQRLLKQQRRHRPRRRSFWDNRNVSCKSRDESPWSRRVTDGLCQRFLNPGLMDTVMSDKSSVDRHIVDNIRQHMSRTSLASSGHHKYQFNNNCGIATFTEDSSVFNSSGEELQPHDCKTVQPLLSTNQNGPSKRYSKKLSDRCCNEIDVDVSTKDIHRSIHMSGTCVEQEYFVENDLINGEQSMKHNNTITGRARRTKSNKSLSPLSNSSSSTLSNSSSSTLPDSSSSLTSAVSSSSSFSSDSSSSSSESSSASLSSSTSSVSTSSTPETLLLSTSRPAPSSWPSADIDDPLNERSSVATMAYTSSIRELGVWNGENCGYNNVNNGYIADPIHASHRYMTDTDQIYLNYGYLTDVDQKHVSNSYTKDVEQRYINQSYLAEINQSHVNHGYLTDINQIHASHGYLTDINQIHASHCYLTDINQSHVNQGYITDINQSHVNQGYLTDINQSHVSYNNLTDVDHRHTCIGYLDELEMQECVLTSSGEKTVVYMSDGVVNGHQSITDVQQYLCPVSTSRSCQQIQETKNCWKNVQRNLNKHTSVCKYNSSEFSKQIVLSHFTDDQNCTYPTPRNDVIRSVDDVLKGTCNSVEPVVMDEDDLEVSAVTGQSQLLTNDLDVSAVTGRSQLLTNDCVDETLQISKDSMPASPIFKKAGVHVTSLLIKPQRTHIRSYCKLNNISTLPVITSSLFPAPIQSVCRSVRLTRPRSITFDLEDAHLPLDLKKDSLTADQSYSIIGQCDSIVDRCDSVIGQYDSIVDRCDSDIGQCDSTMIQFDSTVNQCDSTSTDISCGIHSKTTNDSETVAKDILIEIVVVGDNKTN